MEIEYWDYTNTTIRSLTWKVGGEKHRLGLPAVIEFDYLTNAVSHKEWWMNGKRHRIGGPATISLNDLGKVAWKEWWVDGKRHRTDGPASISFVYKSGIVFWEEWWVDGIQYDEEYFDWNDRVRKIAWIRLCGKMKRSRNFIEWFYGSNELGGRRDRRNLREFVTGTLK